MALAAHANNLHCAVHGWSCQGVIGPECLRPATAPSNLAGGLAQRENKAIGCPRHAVQAQAILLRLVVLLRTSRTLSLATLQLHIDQR